MLAVDVESSVSGYVVVDVGLSKLEGLAKPRDLPSLAASSINLMVSS